MKLAEETDTVKLWQDIKSETIHIKQKRICVFAAGRGGATEQGVWFDEVGQALAFSFLKKSLFKKSNLDFTPLSLYNSHSESSNIV